jgi:1-acyl-sn-glycerol-3-phosphate acyltransferase
MAAHPEFAPEVAPLERRRDAYFWRLLVTGASFLAFGIGAVVVGAVLLPLVRIIPASRERRRTRARAVMSGALRLFIGLMHRLGGLSYEFRGRDRLGRPGQLILANHPSLIDVVFLLAFVPGAGCVVKAGLWRNPLTRGAVSLAEFIRNDSTADMIVSAAAALHEGQPLIFFPEGTRTRPQQPLAFHRSGANIALRAAASVTPVYVRVEPTTLTKAEPWYRIPARRPRFTLVVGEDVDLQAYRAAPLPVASRELNERLREQFEAQRGSAGLLNCAPPGNGRMQHAPDVPEEPTNATGS